MEFINNMVNWVKQNPIAATAAGVGIVGVTALIVSPKARKYVGLGATNSETTERKRKTTKKNRSARGGRSTTKRLTQAELQ